MSFNQNILTIGTGLGSILFYDLNAGRYLQCNCGHTCILSVGQGFLVSTETFHISKQASSLGGSSNAVSVASWQFR